MHGVFQCTCDVTFFWLGMALLPMAFWWLCSCGCLRWPTSIGTYLLLETGKWHPGNSKSSNSSSGRMHSEVFSLTLTYLDFDWPSPKPDFDRQCHPHFPKVRETWGFNIVKWKKLHPAPWCWVSVAFLLSKCVWACVGMLPYVQILR